MSKPEASAGAPSATRATHCTLEELGQKNNILTMRALSADADESWCERNLHKLSLQWKPEEGGAALRSDERDEGGTRHPPGEPLSVGWTTGPPKRLLMVLDLISKNKVQPATRQRPAQVFHSLTDGHLQLHTNTLRPRLPQCVRSHCDDLSDLSLSDCWLVFICWIELPGVLTYRTYFTIWTYLNRARTQIT